MQTLQSLRAVRAVSSHALASAHSLVPYTRARLLPVPSSPLSSTVSTSSPLLMGVANACFAFSRSSHGECVLSPEVLRLRRAFSSCSLSQIQSLVHSSHRLLPSHSPALVHLPSRAFSTDSPAQGIRGLFTRLWAKEPPKLFENFGPKDKGPSGENKGDEGPQKDAKDAKDERHSKQSSEERAKEKDKSFRSFRDSASKKKKDESGEGSGGEEDPQGNSWLLGGLALGVVAVLFMTSAMSDTVMGLGTKISFQDFRKDLLAKGVVEKVEVIKSRQVAVVRLRPDARVLGHSSFYFPIGSIDSFEKNMEQAQRDLGIDPMHFISIVYDTSESFTKTLSDLFPLLLLVGLLAASRSPMMRGGSPFNVGQAKFTKIGKETKIKTNFNDVAGLDEAKTEIMEFVSFLKSPERFTRLGAKLPKGALLVGPPGTGKTLLAKATAGEAGVPFFSITGSDFIELYVGVGPSRVRDLFKQARAEAPCIVFIDEIDAVGRSRSSGRMPGGHDERESTLNQLLVEMDGFNSQTGVVVLAGTNRADVLDSALLRPGRFDRQIYIGLPDIIGRRQIFNVHLRNLKVDIPASEIAERLAALTPGMSGADIANVCNEAALIAARYNKQMIGLVDFESAIDRVIGGLEKKSKVMSPDEKKLVAFHESGHAICGWFLEHADPLLKVTIVPRAQALGYAQYLPQELNLYRQNQIEHRVCMALGGRAAEHVFFGQVSTGAADDLNKVTRMAYNMITQYGMNARVGNLAFPEKSGETEFLRPYSEKTAEVIDEEASKFVANCWERTVRLVEEKRELVEKLATRLLSAETVNHDVLVEVLGPRPYTTFAYEEYVKNAGKKREPKKEEEPKSSPEPDVSGNPAPASA